MFHTKCSGLTTCKQNLQRPQIGHNTNLTDNSASLARMAMCFVTKMMAQYQILEKKVMPNLIKLNNEVNKSKKQERNYLRYYRCSESKNTLKY